MFKSDQGAGHDGHGADDLSGGGAGPYGLGASFADLVGRTTSAEAGEGARVHLPTEDLLFSGHYARSGHDLVLWDDHDRFVVHDYFRAGKRPTLLTPDGGTLSDETIAALAGPDLFQRYAQAGTTASDATRAIGRVETVSGTASAVRNGVTVALNVGDVVYKGDVVQTDRGSALGISFLDGTAFNLSSSARMVLNEMVYQAGGTGNASLMSLVQGSISFVAGQVARTGDMKVDTPVATMGIRGTAVEVTISAQNGETRFSVMTEPDGRVGSYVLLSKTDGSPIATVSQPDTYVTIGVNGTVTQTTKALSDLQAEQIVVQTVFSVFSAGINNPFQPPVITQPGPAAPAAPGGGGGSSTSPDASGAATPSGRPDQNGPGGSGLPGVGGGPGTGGTPGSGPPPQPQTTPAQPDPADRPSGPSVPPLAAADTPTAVVAQASGLQIAPDTIVQASPDKIVAVAALSGLGLLGAAPAAGTRVASAGLGSGTPASVDGAQPTVLVGRYGTLAVGQDGSYVYAPLRAAVLEAGEHGQDVFTFTAADAAGRTKTAQLSFDITGVNDAPAVTAPHSARLTGGGVIEATTRATGLLAGIVDPDGADKPDGGDTAKLKITGANALGDLDPPLQDGVLTLSGAYGTFTIHADGTYRYVADHAGALARGTHGQDVFAYTVTDPSGATIDATFVVELDGAAATVVARNDAASAVAGGTVAASAAGGVLANDSDGARDGTAILAVAEASGADGVAHAVGSSTVLAGRYGTLTLSSDGSYAYTADNAARLGAGQHDSDTFAYTVADLAGDRAGATLSIDVAGVNDAPVGQPDNGGALVRGGTLAATDRPHGVLGNDTDPDPGDAARLVVTTVRASAAATGAAGSAMLTPLAASYLTAGHDLVAGLGGTAGFGESVLPGNDDGSSAAIDVTSIFGAAGLNLFGRHFTSLYVNNNGNITFTAPSSDFVPTPIQGTDSNPIIAALWYDVDTRNGARPATPGGRSTGSNLVYYDIDADNHVFTVTWDDVGYYSGGTDKLNAYQLQLVDRGAGDFDILFRYEATNYGGSTGARAGYSAGDASHSFELPQSGNAAQIVGLADAVGNTGIVGLDVFQVRGGTVTSVAQPVGPQPATLSGAYGTLTIAADGTYSYVADHAAALANGQHATDSFAYTLADPSGATSSATLSFDVTGTNSAPVAQDASAATDEDTPVAVPLRASDADGDALTYAIASGPAHGSVALESGRYVYRPAADYHGTDSFTFTASDGQASSAPARVTIAVTSVNDAPVAQGAQLQTDEDMAVGGHLAAGDVDGDTLTYSSASGPAHGTLAIAADGTFTYTPAANYNGTDSFTFTVSDGQATSAPATVTIAVAAVNDAPVAQADTNAVTAAGGPITGNVLANDSDPDGDALGVTALGGGSAAGGTITTDGAYGRLSMTAATGAYAYTLGVTTAQQDAVRALAAGQSATDTFTYTAADGHGGTADSTLAVTVTGINDAPTLTTSQPSNTLVEDGASYATIALSKGDPDPGDGASYVPLQPAGTTAYGGHFYKFVAAPDISWTDARGGAAAAGGYLASITSAGENDFVHGLVGSQLAWIGASDAGHEGNWQWADGPDRGTTFWQGAGANANPAGHAVNGSYAAWWGAEPNGGRSENDAYIDQNGVWTDVADTNAGVAGYVIELPGDTLQGTYGSISLDAGSSTAVYALDNDRVATQALNAGETATDGFDIQVVDTHGVVTTKHVEFTIAGADDPIGYGYALAGLGDLDGDGKADFANGTPFGNPQGARPGAGQVFVSQFGSGGSFEIDGGHAHDLVGRSVAAAGDVNRDGVPDLVIGAPNLGSGPDGANGTGGAYVVFGNPSGGTVDLHDFDTYTQSTANPLGFKIVGSSANGSAGYSVAGIGDVNGDGIPDVLIGVKDDGTGHGAAYVVYGRALIDMHANGAPIDLGLIDDAAAAPGGLGFKISMPSFTSNSGDISVAAAGDVNGDGKADFIIGETGAHPFDQAYPDLHSGAAYVLYGTGASRGNFSVDALTDNHGLGFAINGEPGQYNTGYAVAGAGDFNGDGYDDVLVGATTAATQAGSSGAAYIVYGGASQHGAVSLDALSSVSSSTTTYSGVKISGLHDGDYFGASVAGAGDTNLDGYADIVVGSPHHGSSAGAAYVINGRSASTPITATEDGTSGVLYYPGSHAGDQLGFSVSGIGDAAGDGRPDYAFGAPYAAGGLGGQTTTSGQSAVAGVQSGSSAGEMLQGSYGVDTIDGLQGDDVIEGLGGQNTMGGGGRGDYLIGGSGHDTFVFHYPDAAGRTVIADFHPASTLFNGADSSEHDLLRLTGFTANDYDSLVSNSAIAPYNSHDTLITLDTINNNHSILLKNVVASSLSSSDFAVT